MITVIAIVTIAIRAMTWVFTYPCFAEGRSAVHASQAQGGGEETNRDKQGHISKHRDKQGQPRTSLCDQGSAEATRDKHAQEGATRTLVTRRWATDCRPIPSKLPPSSHRAAIKLPPSCHLVAANLLTKLSYAAAAAKRQPPPSRKQPQAATSDHTRPQATTCSHRQP